MRSILNLLKHYMETCPFDTGDPDCKTVLDQLYRAYQESHESDPPDIRNGFKELDALLGHLPLDDNNAVFNLCCPDPNGRPDPAGAAATALDSGIGGRASWNQPSDLEQY